MAYKCYKRNEGKKAALIDIVIDEANAHALAAAESIGRTAEEVISGHSEIDFIQSARPSHSNQNGGRNLF